MEVVGAIIKNEDHQYLLQQRDENAPSFRHHWTLFGGRIEEGESPEQAIMRELREELQLSPNAIDSIKLVQTNHHQNASIQHIFEIITSAKISELVLGEGQAMEYVTEPLLFDKEYAFNIKDVLERYIKDSK